MHCVRKVEVKCQNISNTVHHNTIHIDSRHITDKNYLLSPIQARCCNSITSCITSFLTAIRLNWPDWIKEKKKKPERRWTLWNSRFAAFFLSLCECVCVCVCLILFVRIFDNFLKSYVWLHLSTSTSTAAIVIYIWSVWWLFVSLYDMLCVGFYDEFVIQRINHKRVDQLVITY